MVESAEQQIAGVVVDGSPATTPAPSSRSRLKGFERTCAEWRMRRKLTRIAQRSGKVLKDVHWKALTVLDKLHKRDKKAREKSIAEFAREASKGAAGLLRRLMKPCPVWCPRDAAQGEATNPRDAAELAAKSWSRIWRVHVEELQAADRPWETPDEDDTSVLPRLEVDGPSGFRCSGRLIQGQNGHWCRCNPSLHVVAYLRKG